MAFRPALLMPVMVCWLGAPVAAHRLDEYLQATRVAVAADRITLEIDLTPGALTAPALFAALDGDRDGHLSEPEGQAYGRLVVSGLSLDVDGVRRGLSLTSSAVPSRADITAGVGTIRLVAESSMPAVDPGAHWLRLENAHRPDISVYQINTLMPATPDIVIAGQQRDPLQRQLRVTYDVRSSTTLWPAFTRPLLAALAMLAVLGAAVWRRARGMSVGRAPAAQIPHRSG